MTAMNNDNKLPKFSNGKLYTISLNQVMAIIKAI